MGARGTGSGVTPRAKSIRLRFTWGGQRRHETLDLKPTPANIRAAEKMLATIQFEIAHGTFNYARHFPNSVVAAAPTSETTFKAYAETWLKTVTAEFGTQKNYKGAIDKVWVPDLGHRQVGQIKHSDIKAIVAARRDTVSGKTVNNDLIPLRGVFDAAVADGLISVSPARLIKNLKHQSPSPDPFTPDETALILAHLKAHAPKQVWAYYVVAFMTGLRPSEQIIARWGKVDWNGATLRIDTARVLGREKGTKTGSVRDVDLVPVVVEALREMKAFTFMKGLDHPIFCHPATGRPWTNDQYQRVTYFTPTLKKLGIRSRDAYQTRHTFATTALMGGLAPAYIARQMGHATAAMLFKVYAKWIDGADKGREAAKLAALYEPAIGPGLVPGKAPAGGSH